MATYAQISDIRALAPAVTLDASSRPSAGQAEVYLTEVEAEVNAVLGNLGYVTPIAESATSARLIVKDLVAHGALAKVLRARAVGQDSNLLEGAERVDRHYRDRLKALKNPDDPFELPDAERTDRAVTKGPDEQMGSFADDAFDDFDEDAPRVTRAQVF